MRVGAVLGHPPGDDALGSGAGGRILLSFEVGNVDDLLAIVTTFGGTVDSPPNDMPGGQRVAHVADPDGNSVNLTQTA